MGEHSDNFWTGLADFWTGSAKFWTGSADIWTRLTDRTELDTLEFFTENFAKKIVIGIFY